MDLGKNISKSIIVNAAVRNWSIHVSQDSMQLFVQTQRFISLLCFWM